MPETPSVILLHGNDEFAISGHIEKICASLGDGATAGMNIARFDCRPGLDYEALNNAIYAAPFLASFRVTVLEHPVSALNAPRGRKNFNSPDKNQPDFASIQSENGEPGNDNRLNSRKKFIELLERAPLSTSIILAEFEELKRDHWLVIWMERSKPRASIHVYNLPKRWEIPRWIESETKKLGGTIDAGAAAHLSEMVGEDTRIASQELVKLLTYVNYARPISSLDVERVSIVSAQGTIFDLVDALGQQDGKKAQHALHQLLEDEDMLQLWGMVIRQFRLLIQAREILDGGAGSFEVQKTLGLHEYVAQKVTNQAKRFPISALESIYHKLLEIDEGAKIGQVPLDLALDTLIVELIKKIT